MNLLMLKDNLKRSKDVLLHDSGDFFLFVIAAIISTLIFYRQTRDEFVAMLILSVLWIFFWRESDIKGKVFLVFASVVGYVHELIGVKVEFFTYLGGFFGGVPLWVLPGYGAIFWASYNFFKIFEERYGKEAWFSKIEYLLLGATIALIAIDWTVLDLSQKPIEIILGLILSLLLFGSSKEIRLAYSVALFTVFDEIAGEIIGTWTHTQFSIFSLMSGYVFLLWMCLTITEILNGTKKWRAIEIISAIGLFVLFGLDVWMRVS
ncbi:Uncharacterised protein [uncultured archaeon]|nr:Uncharacterised protein [uncultured archaeon]